MTLALVFPGQGSQSVGMLAELAGEFPQVEATFAEASTALGYDLWQRVQNGPESELKLTAVTQPAMLTAGVAVWRAWLAAGGPAPTVMAGHSLGEYSALVCAGALPFAQAVQLVRQRGEFMQQAVPVGAGAMAAVLGLDRASVEAACASATTGRRDRGRRQLQRATAKRDRRPCGGGAARVRGGPGRRRQARGAAGGERALPLRADAPGGGGADTWHSRRRASRRLPFR